ncbi:hypothetical protein [Pedobacter panaciterrae]
MVETLKDFWSELKDRITNPFFGSFMIAWLIINYPIPVTLIFYKQADLRPEYTSFLDVINKNIDGWNMVFVPLVIAFCYTFGFPYFKSFVTIFLAKRNLETDQKISKDADGTMVSIQKYVGIKSDYRKQEIELAQIIQEESASKDEISRLESKIIELNTTHNLAIEHLNTAQSIAIEDKNKNIAALLKAKEEEHKKAIDFERSVAASEMKTIREDLSNIQQSAQLFSQKQADVISNLTQQVSDLEFLANNNQTTIVELEEELQIIQHPEILLNPFLIGYKQLIHNWWNTGKHVLKLPENYTSVDSRGKMILGTNAKVFNRILGSGIVASNDGKGRFKLTFDKTTFEIAYHDITLYRPKTIEDIL